MSKENLKIKADLRKVQSEKNPNLKGFADLTIGDVVIKDVAVEERDTKEGKIVLFNIPLSRAYETSEGEMKYIDIAELSNKNEAVQKNLIKEVRKTLTEALTQEEANEYGKFSSERETDITYDKENITCFTNIVQSEKDEHLRGFANIYIGGVLRINDIAIKEFQNKETGEYFTTIQMPSKAIEKDEKTEYQEQVFPIAPGLRKEIAAKIEESYISELERETQDNELEDSDEIEDMEI